MIAMQSTLSYRPRYCRGISMPACRSCVIFRGDHERSSQMPQTWMGWLVSAVFLGLSTAAAAQPVPVNRTPDATLRSTPETVIWGYFAADIPPVLRIKSGQTVKIDTVSHGGVNTGVDPYARPRAPCPLRRQQLKSRDWSLAGPPHRTDAESHQVRCGAERGVVLQRHRGATAAVHGHHGGSPDAGIMDD